MGLFIFGAGFAIGAMVVSLIFVIVKLCNKDDERVQGIIDSCDLMDDEHRCLSDVMREACEGLDIEFDADKRVQQCKAEKEEAENRRKDEQQAMLLALDNMGAKVYDGELRIFHSSRDGSFYIHLNELVEAYKAKKVKKIEKENKAKQKRLDAFIKAEKAKVPEYCVKGAVIEYLGRQYSVEDVEVMDDHFSTHEKDGFFYSMKIGFRDVVSLRVSRHFGNHGIDHIGSDRFSFIREVKCS